MEGFIQFLTSVVIFALIFLLIAHAIGAIDLHPWGEWELEKDAYVCTDQEYVRQCKICKKIQHQKGRHEADYEQGIMYYWVDEYGYSYAVYKCLHCEGEVYGLVLKQN